MHSIYSSLESPCSTSFQFVTIELFSLSLTVGLRNKCTTHALFMSTIMVMVVWTDSWGHAHTWYRLGEAYIKTVIVILWRQERRVRYNQARHRALSDVSVWKNDATWMAGTVWLVSLISVTVSV